ncbi:MAG: FAD-binding protein [Raoultibacter sp.]
MGGNDRKIVVQNGMSRRGFLGLTGAAMAAAGLGLVGCSGGSTSSSATQTVGSNEIVWDSETDVAVMGFGGAGASAALQAALDGADVQIFEKAPKEFAGGNSTVCEGAAYVVNGNTEGAKAVFRRWTAANVSDEEIAGFVSDMENLIPWLDTVGVPYKLMNLEDNPAVGIWGKDDVSDGVDQLLMSATFWDSLSATIGKNKNIQVNYETPVIGLIFDQDTKEVFGIKVLNPDGSESNIKAKKGVVMACGSFEYNYDMLENYVFEPLFPVYGLGTPYNTGDGLILAQGIGAEIRHCGFPEWGSFCSTKASENAGVAVAMKNGFEQFENLIQVNKEGKRFVNETGPSQVGSMPRPTHDKETLAELDYDGINLEYRNLPFWFVFDATRCQTPICSWSSEDSHGSWSGRHKLYTWSNNNQKEIEAGWVLEAETIEELARKMDVDAATLAQTVTDYNTACETQTGDTFGRSKSLSPVAQAPFYAVEMTMCFINVQGGPTRNGEHQVVDYEGNPIPRLYSAGEFGSIWSRLYHGALNVPEALCGYAAGAHVAALDAWQ